MSSSNIKVLIASANLEASRRLNQTIGQLAPRATYLHADSAERALQLFEDYGLDLVLLDLQLLAKNSAAAWLLRLLNPSGLTFTPTNQPTQRVSEKRQPGVMITFDSQEPWQQNQALIDRLRGAAGGAEGSQDRSKIWAQSEQGEWTSVDIQGLQWAVCEQGKVKLYHASSTVYIVRDRLRELERQLEENRFLRIHKSYLVNSDHISEVQRWSSGGLLLQIGGKHNANLPVSRRYATSFMEKSGLTLGPITKRLRVGVA